jgi:CHAT domain-containing protein
VTVQTPSVADLRNLLPTGETLVEYYGSGDSLFGFVLTRDTVFGRKLDHENLDRDIEAFRKSIANGPRQIRAVTLKGNGISGENDGNHTAAGIRLYEKLIAPLLPQITTDKITVVPHGSLHYLPFAALHDGKGYLLDKYSIRVLPSASVMKFLKADKEGRSGNMLVFGNPDLDDPNLDLPGAEEEARAITRKMQGSKLFTRRQATETAAKTAGGEFRFLHFATHGVFNADTPLASGLLLSKDAVNDGTLSVGELYELNMPADLVTLSACETALGKIANGDDVVGFTRGFLYAGANSIVSSLWKVDDMATSQLMRKFYDYLKEVDKRSALRAAQLHVKNTYNAHPYYWAAFQLTGAVQ